ncbi:MAG: zinc ribbon domain-containing protein [Deltaproteobacteria bacterium]|nr:zinc ribbon domain-containing protein [Deltaproteobacteria bacterium]
MTRGSAEDGRRGPKVLWIHGLVLGVGALFAWTSRVGAQDYAGRWTSSTMRESVTVESWGPDCGPRPSPAVSPGGAVTISMSGAHLSIRGAHSWRTNACWVRSSGMQRRSTSASATSWRTTCASGPNVSQPERGEFSLRAVTPDRLEFRARWENDWRVAESHCRAVFRGTRVYTRASTTEQVAQPSPREPSEQPSAPSPDRPEPATRAPSCDPGPPARIVVRPREMTLAPGERRCFQARVVDSAGCTLPRAAVTWSLSSPQQLGGILSQDGCFSADGLEIGDEGTLEARASAGDLHAVAGIRVRSNDLLDITATSLGPEGAAEAADESASANGGEARGVRATVDEDDDRSALYAGLVAMSALALVLAGVAVFLWRRQPERRPASRPSRASVVPASMPPPAPSPSRVPSAPSRIAPPAPPTPSVPAPQASPAPQAGPAAEASAPPAAAAATPPASMVSTPSRPGARVTPKPAPAVRASEEPMVCPACQQDFEPGAAFCPMDGSKLVSAESAAARPGNVCPACQRGFDANVKVCPHDAEELVPQPLFEATRRGSSPSMDGSDVCKICPTCASRYDVDATFCGRDGSQLVLVN